MSKTVMLAEVAKVGPGHLTRAGIEGTADGTHCLLQMRDFNDDRSLLCKDKMIRFSPGKVKQNAVVEDRDVVFLAKGARNFSFHPGALPMPTLAANYFFVLKPKRNVLPEYLVWFLNHPTTRRQYDRICGFGAAMPVIKISDMSQLELPLPSIEDQENIVRLSQLARQEADLLDALKCARGALIDRVTMSVAEETNR